VAVQKRGFVHRGKGDSACSKPVGGSGVTGGMVRGGTGVGAIARMEKKSPIQPAGILRWVSREQNGKKGGKGGGSKGELLRLGSPGEEDFTNCRGNWRRKDAAGGFVGNHLEGGTMPRGVSKGLRRK